MSTVSATAAGPGPSWYIKGRPPRNEVRRWRAAERGQQMPRLAPADGHHGDLRQRRCRRFVDARRRRCRRHARSEGVAVPVPAVLGVAALQHVLAAPVACRPRRPLHHPIVRRIAVEDERACAGLLGGVGLHRPVAAAVARQDDAVLHRDTELRELGVVRRKAVVDVDDLSRRGAGRRIGDVPAAQLGVRRGGILGERRLVEGDPQAARRRHRQLHLARLRVQHLVFVHTHLEAETFERAPQVLRELGRGGRSCGMRASRDPLVHRRHRAGGHALLETLFDAGADRRRRLRIPKPCSNGRTLRLRAADDQRAGPDDRDPQPTARDDPHPFSNQRQHAPSIATDTAVTTDLADAADRPADRLQTKTQTRHRCRQWTQTNTQTIPQTTRLGHGCGDRAQTSLRSRTGKAPTGRRTSDRCYRVGVRMDRRDLLKTGSAALAGFGLAGCGASRGAPAATSRDAPAHPSRPAPALLGSHHQDDGRIAAAPGWRLPSARRQDRRQDGHPQLRPWRGRDVAGVGLWRPGRRPRPAGGCRPNRGPRRRVAWPVHRDPAAAPGL